MEVPVIFDMNLPLVPENMDLVEVPNPLNGSSPHEYFGKIKVGSNEWFVDYDELEDLWWVNPRPEPKFYEILYTKLFYSSPISEQFGYASLETDSTRRAEKAIKNWEDIEKNIAITQKKSLLEIGCGPGEFLLEAQNRGWKTVVGNELELSSAEIARSRGLAIDTGFFEDFKAFEGEGFDMLFADNVIEHTMDPLIFLQRTFSLTNPNGLLVLRMPDTQPFGPTLKLIDHTFHFTRKSIKTFVERAGYKVETIFYSGTFKGARYEEDNRQRIENMTVIARKI
jgi:2-polyprenyl-3-methyl-5-hydroxy-6-metoxy-1,4-benzoquinol methylase